MIINFSIYFTPQEIR